jgi:hypothetical protein
VTIPRNQLSFFDDFGKLKAILDDGEGRYVISVSSRALKEAYRAGGSAAAEAILPAGGNLHVRLGLARGFGSQPDKCYLMINGVYW